MVSTVDRQTMVGVGARALTSLHLSCQPCPSRLPLHCAPTRYIRQGHPIRPWCSAALPLALAPSFNVSCPPGSVAPWPVCCSCSCPSLTLSRARLLFFVTIKASACIVSHTSRQPPPFAAAATVCPPTFGKHSTARVPPREAVRLPLLQPPAHSWRRGMAKKGAV